MRFNILKRRSTAADTRNFDGGEAFNKLPKVELTALMLGAGNQLGLGQPSLTTVAFSLIRNREVPRPKQDGAATRNGSSGVVKKSGGGVALMRAPPSH